MQVSSHLTQAAWLFGDAGNDMLSAGGGNCLLAGGSGNDQLHGASGHDVLIGGNGADRLLGSTGDDILIAGRTLHDDDLRALGGILAEWSSGRAYKERVANIRGDTGATVILSSHFSSSTVLDDGDGDQIDLLVGNAGTDWFWADRSSGEDKVAGVTAGEQVQEI